MPIFEMKDQQYDNDNRMDIKTIICTVSGVKIFQKWMLFRALSCKKQSKRIFPEVNLSLFDAWHLLNGFR